MRLRHQLAAYSPVTPGALVASALAAARLGRDPRRALAEQLARTFSAESVILCGSGTQALQAAIDIAAYQIERPSAVVLPAFNCFDLASAAVWSGLPIALYDIDPHTLAPDLDSLERTLADGNRIVVIATLYGIPFDLEPFARLAADSGSFLIEDAAQGQGASFCGRPIGSMARLSTLSFGRGKGWTGGRGGAVLLRDGLSATTQPDVARGGWRRELTTVLGLAAQWAVGRPSVYAVPRSIPSLQLGVTTYHDPAAPELMTRAAAAAVLANQAASVAEAAHRRERGHAISAELRAANAEFVIAPKVGDPGYLRFPMRAAAPARLDLEAQALGLERSYPCVLADLDVVKQRLVGPVRAWPGAATLASQLVTAPTHSLLSAAERETVLQTLRMLSA